MKTLTDDLKELRESLEGKMNQVFNSLLIKKSTLDFVDSIALQNVIHSDDIEAIEEITESCLSINPTDSAGFDYYAKVITVSESDGIFVQLDKDSRQFRWIRWTDVNSSYDKIAIIEIMEEQINS